MNQTTYMSIIHELTDRALWEAKNVIDSVPNDLWEKCYCEMPMWKHIYHMLHSLDLWFINPRDKRFIEPSIHEKDLNNLDVVTDRKITRDEINQYFSDISIKIKDYVSNTKDEELLNTPENCEYKRLTLILSQFRHLHSHMGMIMGFIIDDTGMWPRVLGLEGQIPCEPYSKYF